jgi:hypothetical protein
LQAIKISTKIEEGMPRMGGFPFWAGGADGTTIWTKADNNESVSK